MAAAFGGGLAATRVELIPLGINQPTTARRITAAGTGEADIMVEVLMVVDMEAGSEADIIRRRVISREGAKAKLAKAIF
jgi:hypothetical protein